MWLLDPLKCGSTPQNVVFNSLKCGFIILKALCRKGFKAPKTNKTIKYSIMYYNIYNKIQNIIFLNRKICGIYIFIFSIYNRKFCGNKKYKTTVIFVAFNRKFCGRTVIFVAFNRKFCGIIILKALCRKRFKVNLS